MPYVQIRHTRIQPTSSSFLCSFTDVGRVSLPLELLSLQSCPQDSMLTFFFFSDTCWGTLSLLPCILKFSNSQAHIHKYLRQPAWATCRSLVEMQHVQTVCAFPYILDSYRKQTLGTPPCDPGAWSTKSSVSISAVFSVFKTSSERRQALHPTWNNPSP